MDTQAVSIPWGGIEDSTTLRARHVGTLLQYSPQGKDWEAK